MDKVSIIAMVMIAQQDNLKHWKIKNSYNLKNSCSFNAVIINEHKRQTTN